MLPPKLITAPHYIISLHFSYGAVAQANNSTQNADYISSLGKDIQHLQLSTAWQALRLL